MIALIELVSLVAVVGFMDLFDLAGLLIMADLVLLPCPICRAF